MPSLHRSCSRAATATPLGALLLLALGSGCYNPSLSEQPFLCASTGKACPDDYVCDKQKKVCVKDTGKVPDASVESGAGDSVLPASKEGGVYVDGSVVQSSDTCDDKAAEPNNTSETAFKLLNTGRITDWEICYPGDVDHYSIELKTAQRLTVRILFKHEAGDLDAALLNPDGQVIVTARSESDNETLELPTATVPGAYVVAIYGFGTATNRYDLDIAIE